MNVEFRNLLAAKAIIGIVTGFLIQALPLYLSNIGLSTEKLGLLFGIAMIFYAFMDPGRQSITGFVSEDRKGMNMSIISFFSIIVPSIILLFLGDVINLINFEFIFMMMGSMQIIAIIFIAMFAREILKHRGNVKT